MAVLVTTRRDWLPAVVEFGETREESSNDIWIVRRCVYNLSLTPGPGKIAQVTTLPFAQSQRLFEQLGGGTVEANVSLRSSLANRFLDRIRQVPPSDLTHTGGSLTYDAESSVIRQA